MITQYKNLQRQFECYADRLRFIAEQHIDDCVYLLRGCDNGESFRYYVMVPIRSDEVSYDKNSDLMYENDDIRLCTMQRAIPKQRLGITLAYHKQRRVHYLRLTDRSLSSLVYRACLKDYDRIVSLNEIITENDAPDEFKRRFCLDENHSVQLLVCNPATYKRYKSNSEALHNDLPTVQQLVPSLCYDDI
ncbi:unnamed protein product [Adineta ricciae]|uniref:Uncharacterized protein n=1 Tax=Adineta ricciae TaxID=249248 RepID=A0A815KS50_ADIRI|nr:unnamed protein product [Adineta ricciae]